MDNHTHAADAHGQGEHHVFSDKMLKRTFIILCSLTVLTVLLALIERGYGVAFGVRFTMPHIEFGWLSVPLALGIAGVKSYFVASNFMGLKHDKGTNVLVFVGSLLFLVIFFGFTFLDFHYRDTFEPITMTPRDVIQEQALDAEQRYKEISGELLNAPFTEEHGADLFEGPPTTAPAAPAPGSSAPTEAAPTE